MRYALRKIVAAVFAVVLALGAFGEVPIASATARFTGMELDGVEGKANTDAYIIAGNKYSIKYTSDKAKSTYLETYLYYSLDGVAWVSVIGLDSYFSLPVDPRIVSARLKLTGFFSPLVGSNSYDERMIGPYPVLQPGPITDVELVSSGDGTITLSWTDNSNMESYYSIKREGPDGTKYFTIKNTMDYMGALTYVDKETSKKNGDIYVYTITPVIDKYTLDPGNVPGSVSRLASVKAKSSSDIDIKIKTDFIKQISGVNLAEYLKNPNRVLTNKIALNKNALTLQPGTTEQLTATAYPTNAADRRVLWSSDNGAVATVDSTGKVAAISAGIAKVTAKAADGGSEAAIYVTVTSPPVVPNNPVFEPAFTDTEGHWANEQIAAAVEIGFVKGYQDGTFKPDGNVTRAEFASLLMRALGASGPGSPLTFRDKGQIGAWAVGAIEQAVQLGIISGYTDGTFRPNAGITHAEMVAMVFRASKLPLEQGLLTGYADDPTIPAWAKDFVATAKKYGMLDANVTPNNRFGPSLSTTRAEAVSVILGMLSQ